MYKSEIDYESWQVLFANMCALRVTKSGLAPTLKLGLAHRITLGHKVNWKYGSPSHFETVKIRDYSFAKKVYEIGPVVGLSIEFHRIGLALDYCITNNWSKLTLGEQADTKMLALHASYRLF